MGSGKINGLNAIILDAKMDGEHFGIMYTDIPAGGVMEVLLYSVGNKDQSIILSEVTGMIKNATASFAPGEEKPETKVNIDAIDTRLFK